jgi:hypothetical protein
MEGITLSQVNRLSDIRKDIRTVKHWAKPVPGVDRYTDGQIEQAQQEIDRIIEEKNGYRAWKVIRFMHEVGIEAVLHYLVHVEKIRADLKEVVAEPF